MHGGGHYRGSSRVAAPVCSHLSSLAGVDCLSVNYRVAPEHKWPVAVDDCFAAYTWLVESGVAPEKIIIGGDSAGGDLAFSLLLKLRDEAPELLPAGAIGLSPWTDLTQSGGTFDTNADSGVSNCVRSAIAAHGCVALTDSIGNDHAGRTRTTSTTGPPSTWATRTLPRPRRSSAIWRGCRRS